MINAKTMLGLAGTLAIAGSALAGGNTVMVSDDIAVSTTWTADNTYNLVDQVYVLPGATLTIEPGTVIASTPTANGSGSLAVTRGARIIADGTRNDPIIFTSTDDVATWASDPTHPTGGDPKTGTWREAANEWGNLTIMGNAYISNSFVEGNTSDPNPNNVSPMEGLTAAFPGDPNVLYGGGDDDDDSGSLSYVSIRYAGRVVGLGNELNGLSLGGIGRETDVSHVEIMNNVDDGIEIWGGTVNVKYFNIWNVGDDSFDIDQGWRGKAQFGLIVQGYSQDASQGSGVGDNLFETDGAEDSDAQPVTTTSIYNVTVLGQPAPGAGDHGTAWRDNARVQYRNMIFMDLGDRLVSFDNVDGDGANGYGFNGTLGWGQTWSTPYNNVPAHGNDPGNPGDFYTAQSAGDSSIGQGFLAEITDSVFFRNLAPNAYTESNARGVTLSGGSNPAKGNVVIPGFEPADAPIASLERAAPVTRGGTTQLRVTSIDPRPANEAVSSMSAAPDDGFFTPADYRGGFGPDENWLCTWTAAWAYGFVVEPSGGCDDPAIPEDLNEDGVVNVLDMLQLLGAWGTCAGCPEDLNDDGTVNVIDLLGLLSAWG